MQSPPLSPSKLLEEFQFLAVVGLSPCSSCDSSQELLQSRQEHLDLWTVFQGSADEGQAVQDNGPTHSQKVGITSTEAALEFPLLHLFCLHAALCMAVSEAAILTRWLRAQNARSRFFAFSVLLSPFLLVQRLFPLFLFRGIPSLQSRVAALNPFRFPLSECVFPPSSFLKGSFVRCRIT